MLSLIYQGQIARRAAATDFPWSPIGFQRRLSRSASLAIADRVPVGNAAGPIPEKG